MRSPGCSGLPGEPASATGIKREFFCSIMCRHPTASCPTVNDVAQWTTEQWGRISAGLDSVLELSGDERECWVAQLEISDRGVGRQPRKLVATHEAIGTSSFLDRSPLDGLDRASDLTEAST